MQVHNSFDCAMCGQCCANQDLIQLTAFELYMLADGLNMSPAELFTKHCVLAETSANPDTHLYIRTTDFRCPFLAGSLCSVHEFRPYACRAYPVRALSTAVGDMKNFIRQKYPMLEKTCSISGLNDEDILSGDSVLLAVQAIAYMVDDIYFNTIRPENVDLSVPYSVTQSLMNGAEIREAALAHLYKPEESRLKTGPLPGLVAVMLQARQWGMQLTMARPPSRLTIEDDPRLGKYVLAATDRISVAALQALVEGGMAACRAFQAPADAGKTLISAIYAPSAGTNAAGFQLEIDAAALQEITRSCANMVYVFFLPEDGSSTRAVGLVLNGVT